MEAPATLLARLTGRWDLSGTMGDVPLRQEVDARWVLGGLYVEMRCRSVLPPLPQMPPYEALYLVGYHPPSQLYVLHLFDTFGVALHPVPGLGQREGASIPFVFAYEAGPFLNRFTWHADSDTWDHELVNQAGGRAEPFATKHLQRVSR